MCSTSWLSDDPETPKLGVAGCEGGAWQIYLIGSTKALNSKTPTTSSACPVDVRPASSLLARSPRGGWLPTKGTEGVLSYSERSSRKLTDVVKGVLPSLPPVISVVGELLEEAKGVPKEWGS